ncbi:MAG: acyltransferase family protein [Acidimicrobiia bacterium]
MRDLGRSVRQLVDLTPPTRDRYVDFLRALAILAVVAGHWLVATISHGSNGIVVGNVLSTEAALRPATWVFQVMGLFFVVGGFSTRRRIERRSDFDAGAFFASRAERLLRPTVVFVVAWTVAAVVLSATTVDAGLVHSIARIAAQPLWFLAVYLVVTLIAPAQLAIHRRSPAALLVVLPVLVAVVDGLRLSEAFTATGVLNYLFVFAFAQELGFHLSARWDRFRPRAAVAVAAGAAAVLGVLVTVGPYPVSMVGLPGARVSNMSPPTICIVVLTVLHVALATAVRGPARRWLQRGAVWTATVAANAVIMTVFLWHLSAAAVVGGVFDAVDVVPVPGSAGWWAWKVPWFVACAAVLAVFVALFAGFERAAPATRGEAAHAWRRALGMLLTLRALAGFALTGFDHLTRAGGSPFLGTRFSPFVDLLLLLTGYLLACGVPRRRRIRTAA